MASRKDAAIFAGGVWQEPEPIDHVLAVGRKAHIHAATIKAVAVDVIDRHIVGGIHDHAVHVDFLVADVGCRVVASRSFGILPLVLRETVKVLIVNNSDVPTGQGNFFGQSEASCRLAVSAYV